ncbi:MAG: hypothetical protein IJF12_04715 [Alphaproteobacteria bacterium]|nr:hypothetical protein [Alphaproteobacteria bacterium]
MRKYFLLSAVALLSATTANATTDYAEVTARATIEVAGTFECDDIDYGTIVVKQNNKEALINSFDTLPEDIISISNNNASLISCSVPTSEFNSDIEISDVTLKNEQGDVITLTSIIAESATGNIHSQLLIPNNVKTGEYTGSFTLTYTY